MTRLRCTFGLLRSDEARIKAEGANKRGLPDDGKSDESNKRLRTDVTTRKAEAVREEVKKLWAPLWNYLKIHTRENVGVFCINPAAFNMVLPPLDTTTTNPAPLLVASSVGPIPVPAAADQLALHIWNKAQNEPTAKPLVTAFVQRVSSIGSHHLFSSRSVLLKMFVCF